jgi:hypothetical protein
VLPRTRQFWFYSIAMLELDAHSWVSLINESRVSASWVINSSLSTMFRKQRDELVLRKQAELNAIQRKFMIFLEFFSCVSVVSCLGWL